MGVAVPRLNYRDDTTDWSDTGEPFGPEQVLTSSLAVKRGDFRNPRTTLRHDTRGLVPCFTPQHARPLGLPSWERLRETSSPHRRFVARWPYGRRGRTCQHPRARLLFDRRCQRGILPQSSVLIASPPNRQADQQGGGLWTRCILLPAPPNGRKHKISRAATGRSDSRRLGSEDERTPLPRVTGLAIPFVGTYAAASLQRFSRQPASSAAM
jgi:hypothetical protein